MSAALKPMPIDEFLAWEERQEFRYEFDGFRPVAMTGGTIAHDVIGQNIRTDLTVRLRGSRCTPLGPNTKIAVAGRIRYPDALVVCSPLDRKATVIADPIVVFEVLGDSTAHIDYFEKLREYTAAPSIRRYVNLLKPCRKKDKTSLLVKLNIRETEWYVKKKTDPGGREIIPVADLDSRPYLSP